MRAQNPNAMKERRHYFDGDCIPEPGMRSLTETFSVGIFQAVLTKKGDRCKRGPVLYRVKGKSSQVDRVFARATEICRIMDLGFWHGPKKSETV